MGKDLTFTKIKNLIVYMLPNWEVENAQTNLPEYYPWALKISGIPTTNDGREVRQPPRITHFGQAQAAPYTDDELANFLNNASTMNQLVLTEVKQFYKDAIDKTLP